MVQKPVTGWRRAALNLFIAAHLVMLLFWGLPESVFRSRVARPFEKYITYVGLWHIWGMFSPNPLNIHYDVRAQVKYQDGSVAEWHAPRMEELSVWERMPKERYRKWRERIRAEEYSMIWDDTAHYISRQMIRDPRNPPVEVRLSRYWQYLPKPNLQVDYQPVPKTYTPTNSFTYATIPIRPEDLL